MKARYASHYTTWDRLFSPGIEPGTFCVLDRCDNHYTTKTCWERWPGLVGDTPTVWVLPEGPRTIAQSSCVSQASRDRIVVSTLRCGRSNPGSNPGHGRWALFVLGRGSPHGRPNGHLALLRPRLPTTARLSQLCWAPHFAGSCQRRGYSSVVEQSAAVR